MIFTKLFTYILITTHNWVDHYLFAGVAVCKFTAYYFPSLYVLFTFGINIGILDRWSDWHTIYISILCKFFTIAFSFRDKNLIASVTWVWVLVLITSVGHFGNRSRVIVIVVICLIFVLYKIGIRSN